MVESPGGRFREFLQKYTVHLSFCGAFLFRDISKYTNSNQRLTGRAFTRYVTPKEDEIQRLPGPFQTLSKSIG